MVLLIERVTNHVIIHVVRIVYHGLREARLHHVDHALLRVQHLYDQLLIVLMNTEAAHC